MPHPLSPDQGMQKGKMTEGEDEFLGEGLLPDVVDEPSGSLSLAGHGHG